MRRPQDHYAEADRLLSLPVVQDNPTLPIARAYIALAAVHAQLSMYPDYYEEPGYYGAITQVETKTPTGDRL